MLFIHNTNGPIRSHDYRFIFSLMKPSGFTYETYCTFACHTGIQEIKMNCIMIMKTLSYH